MTWGKEVVWPRLSYKATCRAVDARGYRAPACFPLEWTQAALLARLTPFLAEHRGASLGGHHSECLRVDRGAHLHSEAASQECGQHGWALASGPSCVAVVSEWFAAGRGHLCGAPCTWTCCCPWPCAPPPCAFCPLLPMPRSRGGPDSWSSGCWPLCLPENPRSLLPRGSQQCRPAPLGGTRDHADSLGRRPLLLPSSRGHRLARLPLLARCLSHTGSWPRGCRGAARGREQPSLGPQLLAGSSAVGTGTSLGRPGQPLGRF